MRIAVVIPAYNEAGNIGRLIEETIAAVPEATLQEVIVLTTRATMARALRQKRC